MLKNKNKTRASGKTKAKSKLCQGSMDKKKNIEKAKTECQSLKKYFAIWKQIKRTKDIV